MILRDYVRIASLHASLFGFLAGGASCLSAHAFHLPDALLIAQAIFNYSIVSRT